MDARTFALPAAATIAVLMGGVYLFTEIDRGADRFEACRAGQVAGGDIGGPFTLVSESGETVTEADVITRPTLVYFGYTFCPDVCPMDMDRNAMAMEIMDEAGVEVDGLFVSIDPGRDTPEHLAEFTDYFHPRVTGLTGTEEQVAAASQAYRTYYRHHEAEPGDDFYLVDHSTMTYLMDPQEGFLTFFRRDVSPEAMAERVSCFAERV
ncbi:MAG: SCO family protein [Shimia sp.]